MHERKSERGTLLRSADDSDVFFREVHEEWWRLRGS